MGLPKFPPEVALLDQVFALGLIKNYSLALDGGANVGDWTARLLDMFDLVWAIDASQECVDILDSRFPLGASVTITHAALLDEGGRVRVISPNKKRASQKRYVELDDKGDTLAITIDSLGLPECGLIKLDLEGAEGLALIGARQTIAKYRPVLIVELFREQSRRFGHTEAAVMEIIKGLGYRQAIASGPNRVFVNEN